GSAYITRGRIRRTVHGDCRDLWSRNPEIAKKCIEVAGAVAASQLDHSDALPGARRARGKAVRLRNLRRREGNGRGLCVDVRFLLAQAKMRFGLRAIVQPENAFNDEFQLGGNREAARAAAVRARTVLVAAQVRAKRVVKRLNRAAEFHYPARAILVHNLQAVLRGKR